MRSVFDRAPVFSQTIDRRDHHHAVQDRHYEERDEAPPAEIEKGIPRSARAMAPPTTANGTPAPISSA